MIALYSADVLKPYALNPTQLRLIEKGFYQDLIGVGVNCVMLIDMIGNIVLKCDNGRFDKDMDSLAALASASFSSVNAMAAAVGEKQFSLLFHRGRGLCVHFIGINDDLLLVSIFGKEITLGIVRMKLEKVMKNIKAVMKMKRQ